MHPAAARKAVALVVVGVAVLVGGRLFRPVVGAKEHINVECRMPAASEERRLDLAVTLDGKLLRSISVPLAAGQDFAAPGVDLRPGHYGVDAMTQVGGRPLTAHTFFDVPGATPVLMLSPRPGVIP